MDARLSEIVSEMDRARQLRNTLRMPAVEEKVAGLPAGPGSHRARYEAACHYLDQLADEAHAIHIYLSELCAHSMGLLGKTARGWSGLGCRMHLRRWCTRCDPCRPLQLPPSSSRSCTATNWLFPCVLLGCSVPA